MSSTSVSTPSVLWHASTSALRRCASGPPACAKWPTSPLVSATSFTFAPCAANSAAVPPNFCSASSGCAPMATMRSGRFVGTCAPTAWNPKTVMSASVQRKLRWSANDLLPTLAGLLAANESGGLGRVREFELRGIPEQTLVRDAQRDDRDRDRFGERRDLLEAALRRLGARLERVDPLVFGARRVVL